MYCKLECTPIAILQLYCQYYSVALYSNCVIFCKIRSSCLVEQHLVLQKLYSLFSSTLAYVAKLNFQLIRYQFHLGINFATILSQNVLYSIFLHGFDVILAKFIGVKAFCKLHQCQAMSLCSFQVRFGIHAQARLAKARAKVVEIT